MLKNTPMRNNDAKQIKKIRKILKTMGYLARPQRPMTEAERVKLEGRKVLNAKTR